MVFYYYRATKVFAFRFLRYALPLIELVVAGSFRP